MTVQIKLSLQKDGHLVNLRPLDRLSQCRGRSDRVGVAGSRIQATGNTRLSTESQNALELPEIPGAAEATGGQPQRRRGNRPSLVASGL